MITELQLSGCIDLVEEANRQLRSEKSQQAQEQVCIESRGLYGILEDDLLWGGPIESEEMTLRIRSALETSVNLMADNISDISKAVTRRWADISLWLDAKTDQELQVALKSTL